MATITEDYVSFETAKLLKKKCFYGQYRMYYVEDGKYMCSDLRDIRDYAKSIIQFDYLHRTKIPAPTLQMAMKWLREVHHLAIIIIPHSDILNPPITFWYTAEIYDLSTKHYKSTFDELEEIKWRNYDKACEAAIKYCLENLI